MKKEKIPLLNVQEIESMIDLKSFRNSAFHHPSIDVLTSHDLTNMAKSLCDAYKNDQIPKEYFEEIISHLLSFYIEQKIEKSLTPKLNIFSEKLNNRLMESIWNK